MAWVTRVVVTTPVARPDACAQAASERRGVAARCDAQSPRVTAAGTPIVPMFTFTPVISAVAVAAESLTWASAP